MNYYLSQQNGFALLLSVIVSSIVLAIGIAILQVSVNQINLASTARESEIAFQVASAGVDCMWYHRNKLNTEYTTTGALTSPPYIPPSINCFAMPAEVPTSMSQDSSSNGVVNTFTYEFDMGNPVQHCVKLEMSVMNANGGAITKSFGNEAVGNNGSKTCAQGGICTVLFSTGHNRSCATLGTSIFSVQRELTVEF